MELVSLPTLYQYFYDADGKPLSGGRLFTYRAKTNIKQVTYKDADKNSMNENPIILDANGACRIFIENVLNENDEEVGYRFELFDKNGVLVFTEDNIYAINGVDGKNTGIVVEGPPGQVGPEGKSIKGEDGPIGDTGSQGIGGQEVVFISTTGLTKYQIKPYVKSINVTIVGGGGGFKYETAGKAGTNVCSGFAGKVVTFDLPVTSGDICEIFVGDGGIVSTSETEANGKSTTFKHKNLPTTRTASGGLCGRISASYAGASYYERMNPYINEVTGSNQRIEVVPQGISGEDCPPYGQGGTPFRLTSNNKPDANGYGAAGGTTNPTIEGGAAILKETQLGKGSQGLCIIRYNVDKEELLKEGEK